MMSKVFLFLVLPLLIKADLLPLNKPKSVVVKENVSAILTFSSDSFRNTNATLISILLKSAKDANCVIVSVQDPSASALLTAEENVRDRGLWHTMTSRGAVTLQRVSYPNGFHLVLVPETSEEDCKGNTWRISSTQKIINVTVTEAPGESVFWVGLLLPVSICLLIIVTAIVGAQIVAAWIGKRSNSDEETSSIRDWLNTLVDPLRKSLTPSNHLTIEDLTIKPPEHHKKRDRLYMCSVVPVGFYYFLPTLQLLSMYLFTTSKTGNLDLCYYNFECAHPLWIFNDFNHVLSNIGYLCAGLSAALWVFLVGPAVVHKCHEMRGIPHHSGLNYALAFAICVEGILSASYHVCPNHSNFHLDTCFMFICVTLTGLKLYQARHPERSVSGPTTFLLLALLMILDFLGELFDNHYYFWAFSVVHLTAYFAMVTQMYYLGKTSIWSRGAFDKIWSMVKRKEEFEFMTASKDIYVFILWGLGNNVLVIFGVYFAMFKPTVDTGGTFDFGTYILIILAVNMLTYFYYYLAMKWVYRETFSWTFLLLINIALGLWAAGGYFFTDRLTRWEKLPHESRELNRPCTFYDSHDYWHFLSAGALFMTFLALEFLDIDLLDTAHNRIPVF